MESITLKNQRSAEWNDIKTRKLTAKAKRWYNEKENNTENTCQEEKMNSEEETTLTIVTQRKSKQIKANP
jgi:hypothetical protein